MSETQRWHVIQTVELGAPAAEVWEVMGGFFNLHTWHPDIEATEIPTNQTQVTPLRRVLTFPGQPKTTEELLSWCGSDYRCRYKWFAGAWGESVQDYVADLRVFAGDMDRSSFVQWSSTFRFTEDALSKFYWNGFRALQARFPLTSERGES